MSQTHHTLLNVSVSPYGCITHSQDTAGVSKLEKRHSLGLILVYTASVQLRRKKKIRNHSSAQVLLSVVLINKKMVTNPHLTNDRSDLMQYIDISNRSSTRTFPVVVQLHLSPNVEKKGTGFLTADVQGPITHEAVPFPRGLLWIVAELFLTQTTPPTFLFNISDKVESKVWAFLETIVFIRSNSLFHWSSLLEDGRLSFPTLRPRG